VDDEGNIVRALESGAEDYVTKPFRLLELLARIKRVIVRKNSGEQNSRLMLGRVAIDTAIGRVYIDGEAIELTALEYRLLLVFASNRGRILSRTQILEQLWDTAGNFVEDNTLTVYIKRLREKLSGSMIIETVRGIGYRVD
jgi:DNA-binding response OmpR family regulator